MGKWLMIIGVLAVLVGAALQFAPWLVNWFGKLPGDLRIGSGNTRVFIPITSMLLLSVVLTIIVNLFRN
jgi:H+/Cl- antiporter ClcA